METPPLSHRKFQILCALIDGRERRECELRKLLKLKMLNQNFSRHLERLHADGLVEKNNVLARRRYKTERGTLNARHRYGLYKITDEGRRAWRETADFYLFLIERFAGESGESSPVLADKVTILTRSVVPPNHSKLERIRARSRSVMGRTRRLNKSLERNGGKSCKRQ